ncbi:hypothetical protein TNIN_397971 [Trichonephila inaurata madagascariensis]|uniref:Uncharacterized protein n=1 Tax=Trichonephila inaurata madagascariensis TaxID=2747483 RepID=A0A8X6XVE6_9ARAC|nr:hypothetical protein TNIN_397971 [Trichonephila inaurata madagascariensis]
MIRTYKRPHSYLNAPKPSLSMFTLPERHISPSQRAGIKAAPAVQRGRPNQHQPQHTHSPMHFSPSALRKNIAYVYDVSHTDITRLLYNLTLHISHPSFSD